MPAPGPLQPPSGGTYKCRYCSGTFLQRSSLDKHNESFHLEVQCGYCGSTFVGTESMIEHIKDAHPASKVIYNDTEMCFCCEVCDSGFKRKAAYDEHFLRVHVYRKVGAEFVRDPAAATAAAAAQHHGADYLGVLHRCSFCQSRFSDPGLLSHHLALQHGETQVVAAAAKAVRAAAVAAAAAGGAYENLVIDSAALEKHAVDVAPAASAAAAPSNGVEASEVPESDLISNSLNMIYQI